MSPYCRSARLNMIGKALNYLHHEWDKLTRYLDDGRLEIDGNLCEDAVHPFVMGHEGWLFSDSVAGVNASANLYSLVETAEAHGLGPHRQPARGVHETAWRDDDQETSVFLLTGNISLYFANPHRTTVEFIARLRSVETAESLLCLRLQNISGSSGWRNAGRIGHGPSSLSMRSRIDAASQLASVGIVVTGRTRPGGRRLVGRTQAAVSSGCTVRNHASALVTSASRPIRQLAPWR